MNLDYRMSKEQAKQQIQLFRTLYDDVKIEKAEQGKKDPFFQEVLEKKDQATRLEYAGEKILELTLRYAEIDGEVCLIEMIRRLDTEQMKNKESWQKESEERSALYDALYIDALTGAYNRRYYEDKLRKKELEAGVAMMDLDDFKLANDIFGHEIGDLFLITVVRVIKSVIRKTDALIRFGGDEFLLVMPEIAEEVFEGKLKEIRRQLRASKIPAIEGFELSASIGAAMAKKQKTEEVVKRADQMMYQAKTLKNTILTEWKHLGPLEGFEGNESSKKQRQKVLIVDDSEMNRIILHEMLCETFDILEATNGQEGLDILEQEGRQISLVLLDIVMPVMDGFGVLKRMKEKRMIEEVPVIMISAEVSISTIRQAYEMGVADYISRPFDAQIICNRVFNTIKLYAKQRRLMKILTDQAKEKERGQKIMVDILSQIVEFRNGESAPHVHHINILTQMLLEQLEQQTEQYQISPMQRDLIVLASSLHDIGKIGISEKILNKPGPLTAEEYNEMKKHTLIGAQILKNLEIYKDEPLVKVAYKICRWHHERFDGNGYPDGMEGNMIPIAAQVVSVADAYDALVSERTYGKGIPSNQAIRMMKDGECGAFNPILIRCLEIIQDEIPEKVYNRKTLSDNEGTAEERMHHIVL